MSVLATIEPTELQVDPGAEASLLVRVRNRGTIVDRFDIAVVGPTAGWASVDPPSLRLFPDKEGEARVTFRPPRAPTPTADTYPFGVAVRAASDANASTVEEGHVAVAPFVQLTTEIVPQTSRGSRSGTHDVTVHNVGNAVAQVAVKASDPDRLLTFDVVPERAGLKPDGATTIRIRVKPKETFFFGAAKRIPFSAQVDEPTAGSYQIPASIEQHAIIPGWVKPAAALAVAAVVALAFLPKLLFPAPVASVGPSAVTLATAVPTVLATPAPLTAPPTAGPTPSPVVNGNPTAIVVAGDQTAIDSGSGLTLTCASDQPCRTEMRQLLLLMLTNLQGKADGGNLLDFSSTPAGTLPLLVEWKNAIYQYSAAAGNGETNKVRLDLAPILAGYPGYALVFDSASNQTKKFVLPSADGKILFDKLYTMPALPTPVPVTPGGGFDFTNIRTLTDRAWVFDVQLVKPRP